MEMGAGGSASVRGKLVANRDPELELVVRVFWRWIRSDGRVVAVVTVAVRDAGDVDVDDDKRLSGDVGEEVVGVVVVDDEAVVVVAAVGNRKGVDDKDDAEETWMVVPRASALF